MKLAKDLLRQARHLATKEHGRPELASLRRAISTAYYADFHLLSREASKLVCARHPVMIGRHVQRALAHTDMRNACKGISQPTLGRPYTFLITENIHPDLADLARHFVLLQDERHSADYDTNKSFERSHVLKQIDAAELIFRKWSSVRGTPQANVFLMMLFFWKPLSAR